MANQSYQNKVVWITGASSGIGRELALVYAENGADLVLSARREPLLKDIADEISKMGRECLVIPLDVTDENAFLSATEEIQKTFDRLDVVIANAGFGVIGRIDELSADEWRRQLDVNVTGLALTARFAIPYLKKTKGRIALVGSVAAMLPSPQTGAYSASKAAVSSIGQTLSMELHGTGVTCSTLHPGFVESNIGRIDNDGTFHPDREDPRPSKLMWPTRKAADTMFKAIHKRKRELVFTGHGKIFGFIGRHWPGLVHIALSRIKLT